MNNYKVAVVVTTYNRPNALLWVLGGLQRQTLTPDLVVVADDGSRADTSAAIESFKSAQITHQLKVKHIWQPDNGFRAGQIRNKGVAECVKVCGPTGVLIVFLDGDCIPLPDFLKRHVQLHKAAGPGWCVAGGRTLLNDELTRKLEFSPPDPSENIYCDRITAAEIFKWRLRGYVNRALPLISLPGISWRLMRPQKWEMFRTCNASLLSEDFLRINGFNEDYIGWGYEDSDLAIRLIRSGVQMQNGRYATNVLHLWHPGSSRDALDRNRALLDDAWTSSLQAERGVHQYLQESQ